MGWDEGRVYKSLHNKGKLCSLKTTCAEIYTFLDLGSRYQKPLSCAVYPNKMQVKEHDSSLLWL